MSDPTIRLTNLPIHGGSVGLKPLNIAQARKKFEELTGRNITVIADDSFLRESKDSYPPLWAAREVAQNFGDHNTEKNKGTLNGVHYKTNLIEPEKWRFEIQGNWSFNNPDSLMHLGSEGKGEEDTGGNGIALKQVVVRSLRDWGGTKFEVQGNGWNVIYKKLTKEQINAVLNKNGFIAKFNNDLIIAEMESAERRDYCKYIIETSDPELVDALGQIQNIGVSEDNAYLQNPDYKNGLLIIKWLLPEEHTDDLPEGRLFMGCQVARVKREKELATQREENYWGGLRGCTIAIKTPQKKSIDRPPLDKYDLGRDLTKPVKSMSKEDLIGQLKRSERIWSSDKRDDEAECFILIEKIVDELTWDRNKKLKPEEFKEHFGEKVVGGKKYTYIADEIGGIQQSEREELKKKGYIICPHYFYRIGMPTVTSIRTNFDAALQATPEVNTYDQEKRARDSGVFITHEQLKCENAEVFFREIKSRLGPNISKIGIVKGNKGLFKIYLKAKIDKNELIIPDLAGAEKKEHKNLHFLRGVFHYGLSKEIFIPAKTALIQGEVMGKFGTYYYGGFDSLQIKIIDYGTEGAPILQLEVAEKDIETFKKVFSEKETNTKVNDPATPTEGKGLSPDEPDAPPMRRRRSRLLTPLSVSLALLGLTTVGGILGLIFVLRSDGVSNGDIETDRSTLPGKVTINTGLPKEKDKQIGDVKKPKDQFPGGWDDRRPRETEAILDKFLKSKDPNSKRIDGAFDENNKHLRDIAGNFNKADIKLAIEPAIEKLEQRIGVGTDDGHVIENFKIVQTPTKQEIAKINLLRRYIEITLSHGRESKFSFENDIIVFTGDGTKGFNYKGLIGLHQELLKPGVKFEEALSVTFHEEAHEALRSLGIKGHGGEFISTLQSLNAAAIRGQAGISREVIRKSKEGEQPSEGELLVTNAARLWEELGK